MYKKNPRSQQPLLLSDLQRLPDRSRDYLQRSWADTFRREVFLRIPEDCFRVLYDPDPSRPNVPVNLLVGLDILKELFGWSDEELYEHFLFDLQVRYALGCDNLDEANFDLRTLYYFRRRVSEYALLSGQNLYQEVFTVVTGEQLQKLGLKTNLQRMDSTQLLSNIADASRLELLVQALQRLYRCLTAADQTRYDEHFAPYLTGRAGQYVYRIKGKAEIEAHLQQTGLVLHELLSELAAAYAQELGYRVAERCFAENYRLVEGQVQLKPNEEIEAGCLQSLDDLEATYRVKGRRSYKGYAGNLTETCHPDNPLQLILHTQTQPNRTSDVAFLEEALPVLKEHTGLKTLVSDGAYLGPSIDQAMRDQEVEHITTGLAGGLRERSEGKLAFSDFELDLDREGEVTRAVCPAGQEAEIRKSAAGKSFRLSFAPQTCQECAFYQQGQCPVKVNARKAQCGLTIPKDRAGSSQRRRRFEQHKAAARNLRTAVEATVFQVKHTLRGGKLRVRGLFRVATVFTWAALAVNLRRINRYENDKQRGKHTSKKARAADSSSIFVWTRARLAPLNRLLAGFRLNFGC